MKVQSNMWLWPLIFAALYFVSLFGFAVAYFVMEQLWECPINFPDSLYFSAVTITTLGYGDITPQSTMGKYLAASEAVVGITLIGLFLTALAYVLSHHGEAERKEAHRNHFLRQYEFFKLRMIDHCVDAVIRETGNTYIHCREELIERLQKPSAFNDFFTQNKMNEWYNLQNGMQYNEEIISDMYLELDILAEQTNQLLVSFGSTNQQAITEVTSFYQAAQRIRHGRHTSHDPAKYYSQFIFEVLANKRMIDHSPKNDEFIASINAL